MNYNTLFQTNIPLPSPLSKEEEYILFQKMYQGDKEAKNKLIEHNIKLVLYEVKRQFSSIKYYKEDIIATGMIGLIKAVNSYNTSKNKKFISYALICIDNEILMFLKQLRKVYNISSLETPINKENNKKETTLKDVIYSDTDLLESYITKEMYQEINKFINNLPEMEQEVIKMRFGFYEDKIYSQEEIGKKFNISQSYTSRLIRENLKQLQNQLERKKFPQKKKRQLKRNSPYSNSH